MFRLHGDFLLLPLSGPRSNGRQIFSLSSCSVVCSNDVPLAWVCLLLSFCASFHLRLFFWPRSSPFARSSLSQQALFAIIAQLNVPFCPICWVRSSFDGAS